MALVRPRACEPRVVRVLVVHPAPPAPEGGAADRCGWGLVVGLRANGVEVRSLAAAWGDGPTEAVSVGDVPVEVVPVRPARGWRGRARHLRRPLHEIAGGELAARVQELAADVDAIQLDTTEMTWCAPEQGAPAVLHVHYRAHLDRRPDWPWRRPARELALYALLERAALRRHDHFVASSPVVAATLRRARPSAEVVLAPLTLDPSHYPRAPLDGPPRAGIIGTATWPPTARALRHLAEVVWPAVRRQVPDAVLEVAGRGTDQLGLEDWGPGVEVVGEVASSSEFLRGLSMLLYPLDRGSGMKVKVLESLASGLPVVTTPCGAEGIADTDGVVVAESDRELVAAAAAILSDPVERSTRGEAAWRTFSSCYSPAAATEPLADLYRRLRG